MTEPTDDQLERSIEAAIVDWDEKRKNNRNTYISKFQRGRVEELMRRWKLNRRTRWTLAEALKLTRLKKTGG